MVAAAQEEARLAFGEIESCIFGRPAVIRFKLRLALIVFPQALALSSVGISVPVPGLQIDPDPPARSRE